MSGPHALRQLGDSGSIAAALCGILLKSPKADDALLLYSYASSSDAPLHQY